MKVRFPQVTLQISQARTNTKRFYRDPALKWAEANPTIAARCLAIPPDDEGGPVKNHAAIPQHDATGPSVPRSFDDYWSKRGSYVSTVCSQADIGLGKSLSTHVLSAPLTLATQLFLSNSFTKLQSKVGTPFRCCCLGARAEAQLPIPYWREILVVWGWQNATRPLDVELDFLGPDVVPRTDSVTVQYQGSQLRLRWVHSGTFHDYVARDDARVDQYDAFVLFNPGLGHRNLQRSWDPTIDVLRGLHRPVLLTAHSALDAARDSHHLHEAFDASASYTDNPFASRITYEDPFDPRIIVRPNHSVALL